MRRVLMLWLACWGCSSESRYDGVLLFNRADDAGARLEEALLTPYRARHPGMRVFQQHVAASQPEYTRRLQAALVNERPPDAVLFDDIDVPALAEHGRVLDLSPFLARVGVDLGRYDPAVLAIFRRGGAVYALPRGYTPLLLVYNRDLLDRAGISTPTDVWTWDDFLDVAKRLTRAGDGNGHRRTWGVGWDRRPSTWLPWIWSGGGDVLCPDGRRASGCLDAPATVAAIRWYAGWVTRDRVAPEPYEARDWDRELVRLLLAGRLGMMTVDHSDVPAFRDAAEGRGGTGRQGLGLRLGFVAIPHRPGVAPVTVLHASGYAVPALTLGRKPAVELVAALTDSFTSAARGESGMELPAVRGAAAFFAASDTLGWESAFVRVAAHGRPGWGARITQWGDVESVLSDLMDRIITDGVDVDAAVRAAARDLDRLLGATR